MPATKEAQQFNGLSQEAFFAGHSILTQWQVLDPAAQQELLPALMRQLVYEMLDTVTDEGIAAGLAEEMRANAETMEYRAIRIHAESIPFEPLDDDQL